MKRYEVLSGDDRLGAMTLEDLRGGVLTGEIQKDARFSVEGEGLWRPVQDLADQEPEEMFFAQVNGVEYGPASLKEMTGWHFDKRLTPSTRVRKSREWRWQAAINFEWARLLEAKAMAERPVEPPPQMPQTAVNNYAAQAVQPKSRAAYALLAFFLGATGIHNFYAGHVFKGAVQLLLLICTGWMVIPIFILWAWSILDILITSKDGNGVRMV